MTLTGKTRVLAVWGCPVGHSRSPTMHNAALAALGLDWVYVPMEVAPAHLPQAINGLRAMNLVGVNLTVPLKEQVLPLLDEVSAEARRVGSVNTIHNRAGSLYGDSTDGAGFLRSLEGRVTGLQQALLLGAGGSARAVAFALAGHGCRVQISNRTAARARRLAEDVNEVYPGAASVLEPGVASGQIDLLVNTTSAGMAPQEALLPPLPPDAFAARPLVYDLIYAPPRTRLLALAADAGCETVNGVEMLAHQGALSLALWTERPVGDIPVGIMEQAIRASLA